MLLAKWVFRISGIYGLIVLTPFYFLEERIGVDTPPPITHPEFFYGFVGVALVWQIAFLIIATDPIRYRPLMIASILEKITYGIAAILLFVKGRIGVPVLAVSCIDLVWAVLFCISFLRTPKR